MREIKFRQPIFNKDGSFRFWNYWGYIDGRFVHPEGNNDSYQYIGIKLKDKEVYERDILSPLEHLKEEGNQVVEHCADAGGFRTSGDLQFDECAEIVGNIHETPQLMPKTADG